MKQKMTKLLSLALLIAMVLSLCAPAAFADDPLPETEDKKCSITSYNKTSGTSGFYEIVITGLEDYNLTYEYTSTWFTLSGNIVTAAHSAIEYKEDGSAIDSHTDTVTVKYSKGEKSDSFKVDVNVTDNDAVVLNKSLKELKDKGANGLLELLKYIAYEYKVNSDDSRENALLTHQGSAKVLMDLIVKDSGIAGVQSGEISSDRLNVNVGTDMVGTLVFGNPDACKVETRTEISEQNEIAAERARLAAKATGSQHEKLESLLKYMAENGYTVDSVTGVDNLLLNKKGTPDTYKQLLSEYVPEITECTTDINGLIIRMTEGSTKYIGTMVSGDLAATKVTPDPGSPQDADTLYYGSKGFVVPGDKKTEYLIDISGLNNVVYEYEDDSWVTVAEGGKLMPQDHNVQYAEDGLHVLDTHSERVTVKSGEKSFEVSVKVVDLFYKQYNAELDALIAAVGSGAPKDMAQNALKYVEENYSNDQTLFSRDEIVVFKKGSGQGIRDLLVDVLKKCGVSVKPGTVDDHILRIYVMNGNENYEGSLTFTDPRTSKVEQKDFSVNGSAIVGYLSDAAVLAFPETVNGYAITTLGQPGETSGKFWNGIVNEITVPASITTIYPTIFKGYHSLKTITVDANNVNYSSKDGALYSKDGSKLIAIPAGGGAAALPAGIKTIGADAIPGGLYNSIVIPQGTTTLENDAIGGCYILFIPDSVTTISKTAFSNVTDVVVVKGSAAESFCNSNGISCHSVTKVEYSSYASKVTPGTSYLIAVQPQDRTASVEAEVTFTADILGNHPTLGWQYSADGKTWKEVVSGEKGYIVTNGELKFKVAQDLDGYKYRVVAGEIVTNAATLTVAANLGESETLTLGDKGYDMSRLAAKVNGAEMCRNGVGVSPNSSVKLANGETALFTTATYKWDSDPHKRYPVGMQVWSLTNNNGEYTMTHLSELDNLLRYSGSSIRVTGKKGIRMITSISEDLRSKLINTGVGGFTLQEYGTCVAWDSALGGAYPVLGNSKSAYAYKRGAADPIFARGGGLISYTNVLVGFTNDQCKPDMSMRPYAVLADKNGNTYTVYGGTVHRSIGYIALQNKNAFKSGTDAYNYIWDIIHTVYGKDYKG